jgi:HPt (histidine-containing phosphotransfer) domain-containing protein
MNIPGELIPIVLFMCIAATAIGVPLAKAFAKRIESQPRDLRMPQDVTARLDRMEQAIDAIAVEIERISEGQRFTTKLLSERVDKAAGAALPERVS